MTWKNRKVLVTGAEGFIGSHLIERLLKEQTDVRAFVLYNFSNSWGWLDSFPKDRLNKIEVFLGDIRDYNSVYNALKGVDIVFNLAALIGIPFSYHAQEVYIDTNVKGTVNILQAARRLKTKKIIHTSTSEVYGTAQYVPIDESHPINPQSPYAATKAAADYLALSFYKSFNIPVTILRPFNTFGPRQSARAVIPTIITQALANKSTIKLGNLKTSRDFTYVTDVADAFVKIAEAGDTEGNIYNVGSNREVSVKEIADLIMKCLNRRLKVVQERHRFRPDKSEVMQLVCDFGKLKETCGWEPKVSLEKGIGLTCKWLKSNLGKYKPDIYNV
jgi:dTDP-glucose 4,6-dehydratase